MRAAVIHDRDFVSEVRVYKAMSSGPWTRAARWPGARSRACRWSHTTPELRRASGAHTKSKPISIHLLHATRDRFRAAASIRTLRNDRCPYQKRVFHSAVDRPGLLQPCSHVVNSQNKRAPSAMDLARLVVGISYRMQVMSVRESPQAERSVELGNLSVTLEQARIECSRP
jgi:hypothetical protein